MMQPTWLDSMFCNPNDIPAVVAVKLANAPQFLAAIAQAQTAYLEANKNPPDQPGPCPCQIARNAFIIQLQR